MRYRLLGPLSVVGVDGGVARIARPKQRTLLAVLLTSANGVVSMDRLVDALWDTNPPRSAHQNLKTYVWSLRLLLSPAAPEDAPIVTGQHGYGVTAEPDEIDMAIFERLVGDGHQAHRAGDRRLATKHFEEALALWRGPAFADVPASGAVIAAEKERLEELRLVALEHVLEARISARQYTETVAELRRWTAQQPLRERLWELLMLALYRSGAQAQALTAYSRLRAVLIDEAGVDPSPRLKELQLRILRADPSLLADADQADDRAPHRHDATPEHPWHRTAEGSGADHGSAEIDAAPHPPVPRQLPARPQLFTGRVRELGAITSALTAAGGDGAVPVAMIVGPGGVGKTWLALRWAHDNLDQFPDGQLYLNLRGFDPAGQPVPPETAVRSFLDALGVATAAIPTSLDAQIGLYRSLLYGKRILILLDNARDADQIRPLLPGHRECAVLITSRDSLTALITTEAGRPVPLGLVSIVEGRALLARRVGHDRVAAEPEVTDELVDLCARLPLAIAMIAARAATRSELSLATLAAQLRDSLNRLDTLGLGGAGDIRAVFSCSYDTLDEDAARLFRLLALHPGADIEAPAAASLAGVHPHRARILLAELTRANLAIEDRLDRYVLHDLLRAYAAERSHDIDTADDRRIATLRLLDYYLHSAHSAYLSLDSQRFPLALPPLHADVQPMALADPDAALAWFTSVHQALIAAVDIAVSAGLDRHAWLLAVTLDGYFVRTGHYQSWLATKEIAIGAANRAGDLRGEALAHRRISEAYAWLGQHGQVAAHLDRANDLYRQIDDTAGRADVELSMGWALEPQRRFREALEHTEKALVLYRSVGDARGSANALNNIGWYHAQLGHYRLAVDYCRRALAQQRRVGTLEWQARTLMALGFAYLRLGQHRQAIDCYENALTLIRAAGHHHHEARILGYLSDAHEAAADLSAATSSRREALVLLRELGHPHPDRLDDFTSYGPASSPAQR
jgi:DNA-binding SARP family transcriptional activator/tetratricopeptide (TPR) repeat protein